jgi:hypothetical protein
MPYGPISGRDPATISYTFKRALRPRGRRARIVVTSRQIGYEDLRLRLPGLLSAALFTCPRPEIDPCIAF